MYLSSAYFQLPDPSIADDDLPRPGMPRPFAAEERGP
jgi:hypothetical protein